MEALPTWGASLQSLKEQRDWESWPIVSGLQSCGKRTAWSKRSVWTLRGVLKETRPATAPLNTLKELFSRNWLLIDGWPLYVMAYILPQFEELVYSCVTHFLVTSVFGFVLNHTKMSRSTATLIKHKHSQHPWVLQLQSLVTNVARLPLWPLILLLRREKQTFCFGWLQSLNAGTMVFSFQWHNKIKWNTLQLPLLG